MYYNNKRHIRDLISKGDQALADLEASSKIKQDSILFEVGKRDSTIGAIRASQRETKEELNKSVQKGKILATDLKKARAERDTVTYHTKCDSLAEHMALLEAVNAVDQFKTHALDSAYRAQLASKDLLLKGKDALYGNLRQAFAGSSMKINELDNKNKKLELKLEKSRKTTRLVALAGAIIAGSIYITTR